MSQAGPYRAGKILLHQLIHDQMSLGAVLQGDLDFEFLRDPDRGQDIVCLVGMGFQGDLAIQHRDQGLQLHVKRRLL